MTDRNPTDSIRTAAASPASGFTPAQPVLTPIRDHAAMVSQAEASIRKFAATRNDRWYPLFHIASDGGWINDPNGLCHYKGRWHVFYQLHPYGTQWGPMHWGHVSSPDMLHWRREPVRFAPSLEQEKDGVFSGSAAIGDDGRLRFYYTGHRWANGHDNADGDWQVQMLAEADNDGLTHATKRGMVVDCPRDRVWRNYRDPKVWKTGDTWYMTFGVTSREHRGQMWLFSSHDMVRWTYERVLFEHPDPDVYMLECPDFFPIRDAHGHERWVIGFSAMGAKPDGFMNRNVSNAGYIIGDWTPGGTFEPDSGFRLWDWGHNFYAPQSFTDGDRQIMMGWMSPFVPPIPMEDDGWCGNLTLPREITLGSDGDLHTAPVAEMTGLREHTTDFGPTQLGTNELRTIMPDAQAVEIEMSIDLRNTTAERAGLRVHATDDGAFTAIGYDAQTRRVVIDRQAAARGDRGYRAAPLSEQELASGVLNLRVFVDRGCVEVYVNDGHQAMSSYSYPSAGPRAVMLAAESGGMTVRKLTVHTLASIGLDGKQ